MALTDKLTAIADAIRAKDETSGTMTLEEMPSKISAITTADNIVHSDIPDYVKSAALEVARKVKAVQTDESITFLAMSDSHQLESSSDIVTGNLHAGMAAKTLAYILNLDFACFLGDYTAGSSTTTIEEGKQHFAEINRDIDEAFFGIPQFRTLGNHDSLQYSAAQNGTALTPAELFELVGKYNDGAVYGSTTDGYCYRDFAGKKVRVICLNTADSGQKENLSDAQKLWFANTLKEAGGKGADWGVIVLSHHPLDWGGVCIASNIVHAYVEGTSITVSSGNTVDFSGSNSAKFLGAFHGHVHGFRAAKLNYIAGSVGTEYHAYRVATPNMCFARNNEYGQNGSMEYYGIEFGEETTYAKTAGTAQDTAFVVNVVNPSEQKIYSFCYGAGYDREIFIGVVTVAVTGISLDAVSGQLTVGASLTLTATVSPEDASNKTVIWTSSDENVAMVSGGVVTAVAKGSATITAKTQDGGYTATYALTVTNVSYTVTNNLSNVSTNNSAASVDAGSSYNATLSPGSGYALGTVTVTMGGIDITSTVYSDGVINITNVTGNIVITANATAVSYTNLVPTSQAVNSADPYNGVGYCNGKYLSVGASPWEGTDASCVLTGNIPYAIPVTGLPGTIYIKGAAWNAVSHCRMIFFTSGKGSIVGPQISGHGSGNAALSKYYTVETLEDNYIKLTPIASTSGTTSMLVSTVANSSNAAFMRFSLAGTGENLIITVDEPIE